MIASRRSKRRCGLLVRQVVPLALAWTVLVGPAAGQVGAPTQLLPGPAPADIATPLPEDAGIAGPSPPPESIEVNTLDAIGTDYAGTLEPGNGGFGPGMWRGTDRVKVERLLPLLEPTTSPILADLTRRLLLSNAAAPAGQGSGANLLALRARLLGDMGLVEEALALLRQFPADQRDAAAARQLTELAWRAGDLDGGCATALESLARVDVDTFWQKAAVFCQLRAGQTTEATLGLDVLHEQGEVDEVFYALADALAGAATAELPPLPVATPLYLAMVQGAGVPLPKIAIKEPPPLMQALIAERAEAPADVRLSAAETAAAVGVLSPPHLIAAYTAEPEDPGLLDTALDLPDIGATPATRAILYQAAVRASVSQLRARLIERALTTDVRDGAYWAALQLYLPLLADLPPSPDLGWFAPAAARHLYAGGRLREAGQWLPVATQPQASVTDLPALLALDYLAGGSGPVPLLDGVLPATGDARAARLRALFGAFDDSVAVPSGDLTASLTATGAPVLPQQNLNLWLDLGDAAAKGRVGETVLLSIAGLNATGLAAAEPEWLARAVDSLRRVGLEEEARRLAVEAAIANGL